MREKEVLDFVAKLLVGDMSQGTYLTQTIKLDEETINEGHIKHYCPSTEVLMDIKFQVATIRVLDKIGTMVFALCTHCKKLWYTLEFTEAIDLEPYKQEYRMMFPKGGTPNKETLIQMYISNQYCDIMTVSEYNAIVLESPFVKTSLIDSNTTIVSGETTKNKEITSWDDV